jgi:hypothetical protein
LLALGTSLALRASLVPGTSLALMFVMRGRGALENLARWERSG